MKRFGLLKSKRLLAWLPLVLGVLVLGLFRFFIGNLPSEASNPPFFRCLAAPLGISVNRNWFILLVSDKRYGASR